MNLSSLFRQTTSVIRKELQVAFASPLVYVFWFVASLLVGLFFYLGLVVSPEPNLRLLTVNLAMANLVLMPMMGMRMFAEEEKQGTLEMMLTLPGSLWSFVIGKFIMGFLLSTMVLFCSLLCTGVLAWLGNPDWGAIVSALTAQGLCLAFSLSVAIFASVLTKEPIASGLLGALLLLPFWMVDSLAQTVETLWVRTLFEDLSLMHHLIPLSKGVVALSDVFWFVGGIGFFLWATERVLEWKRCQ